MRRRMIALMVGSLLALALVVPAAAGGWAVTTVDGVPEDIVAGQTYDIGYTVLQHGQKPVDGMNTSIVVSPNDRSSKPLEFQGKPDGEPGHYVARVTLPTSGEWTWEINQDVFGPYQLGTFSVGEASASSGMTLTEVLKIALPALTLVMVALFAVQLMLVLRDRKAAASQETADPAASWQRPVAGD